MCSLQHGRRLKGHTKNKDSLIRSMQALYVSMKERDGDLTPSTFFSWKERRAHGILLGLPPGDIPGIDDEAPEEEEVLGEVRLSSLGRAAAHRPRSAHRRNHCNCFRFKCKSAETPLALRHGVLDAEPWARLRILS